MTITVKLRKIVSAQKALEELKSFKAKGKLAYDAGKLVRLCNEELELFAKSRQNTVETLGTYNNESGEYEFRGQEIKKQWDTDINQLLDSEVIFEVSLLSYEELEKLDPTVGLLSELNWALTERKE